MIKYFLIGSIGGLLSGILGIGGGVVFVPLLTYLTKTLYSFLNLIVGPLSVYDCALNRTLLLVS